MNESSNQSITCLLLSVHNKFIGRIHLLHASIYLSNQSINQSMCYTKIKMLAWYSTLLYCIDSIFWHLVLLFFSFRWIFMSRMQGHLSRFDSIRLLVATVCPFICGVLCVALPCHKFIHSLMWPAWIGLKTLDDLFLLIYCSWLRVWRV